MSSWSAPGPRHLSHVQQKATIAAAFPSFATSACLCWRAREKIERLAAQSGFEGRLVILAEPEIASGDCRIEWADGGVVQERAAIEARIDELVGRYMASQEQGT